MRKKSFAFVEDNSIDNESKQLDEFVSLQEVSQKVLNPKGRPK